MNLLTNIYNLISSLYKHIFRQILYIHKNNIIFWWSRKYHQWATRYVHIRNNTCIIKKEDLAESTGVVPAKYPPKVKLELFSQL